MNVAIHVLWLLKFITEIIFFAELTFITRISSFIMEVIIKDELSMYFILKSACFRI